MRVENMVSPRSGREVANQFIIHNHSTITFQSYQSVICEIRGAGLGYDNVVFFGNDWDYSTTTAKYRNQFLMNNGLGCLASRQAIEDAIRLGHARDNESIYVAFDPTL